MNWAVASRRVALAAGSQVSTEQLTVAAYALEEAIRHWEAKRLWNYTLTSQTFAITSGTAEYTFPSNFRMPYTARITDTSPRTLEYVDRKIYDIMAPDQTTSSYTNWYTVVNYQDNAKLTLLPTPNANGTLELRYYRQHVIPTGVSDGSSSPGTTALDLPYNVLQPVLAYARAFYLGNRGGPDDRQVFWMGVGDQGYRQAVAWDSFPPDGSPGFRPGGEMVAPTNPNSIYPWND